MFFLPAGKYPLDVRQEDFIGRPPDYILNQSTIDFVWRTPQPGG
jgi:hypothetical protein